MRKSTRYHPPRSPSRRARRRRAARRRRLAQRARLSNRCCRARSGRRPVGRHAQIAVEPRRRPAQGRRVLERAGMDRLELFRCRRLHQAGPAARADAPRRRRPPGSCCLFSPAGLRTSCCCRTSWRRAAAAPASALAAVLVFFLRHAGRNRRVGLPPRRPPPDPVGRRARRPHRLGHAVLVLGAAQPRHQRTACRPQHAQGRGGAGARLVAISPQSCKRARLDRALGNIMSYAGRERANAKGGPCGRRARLGAARPDLAAGRDLRGRVRVSVRPPRSAHACDRAIGGAFRLVRARIRRRRSPTG